MDTRESDIRAFLARSLGRVEWDRDEDIFKSGAVTSLFAMQLILFLEQNFQIVIADEDLKIEYFNTIGAMAQLVARKQESRDEGTVTAKVEEYNASSN